MRIGIFDSGLGSLVIAKTIFNKLPQYDYICLSDTNRVPYGNRSQDTIYKFTKEAVNFLFKQNCALIIIACNTASAMALRRVQQQYLPKHYPGRRVLGIIIPTVEEIGKGQKKIGLLATTSTVQSGAYKRELKKISSNIKLVQQAAPLLVPMIENNELKYVSPVLKSYLARLQKEKVDAILLGCTDYPILKNKIKKIVGKKIKVISQDEIIPGKLKHYLKRHPEIEKKLSKGRKRNFSITALNPHYKKIAKTLFGKNVNFKLVKY